MKENCHSDGVGVFPSLNNWDIYSHISSVTDTLVGHW